MKKAILMISILFQACAGQATAESLDSSTVETVVASTFDALTAQAVPGPSAALTSTPLPALTSTATSLPPFAGDIVPIQFDVNGTYKDVIDHLQAGARKTYSIRAMKGQVMAVSWWGQHLGVPLPVSMSIKGADGQILCPPQNGDCTFWRGELPSSQDYDVTLSASGEANFILRVAISPPGAGGQSFEYKDPEAGFTLTYPDTFAPTNGLLDGYISSGNYKFPPVLFLHLIDVRFFDHTNLEGAYLTVGFARDPETLATCTEPSTNTPMEGGQGTRVVNSHTFTHSQSGGAAGGHWGTQEIYRMVDQDVCYEVILHVHVFSLGNLAPGHTYVEFDKIGVLQALNQIFSTFKTE